jgi:hypothetical protein
VAPLVVQLVHLVVVDMAEEILLVPAMLKMVPQVLAAVAVEVLQRLVVLTVVVELLYLNTQQIMMLLFPPVVLLIQHLVVSTYTNGQIQVILTFKKLKRENKWQEHIKF